MQQKRALTIRGKKWAARLLLALGVCLCPLARAQYVAPYINLQGTLTTASGIPAVNATLTLTPSQVMFVSGTSMVVSQAECSTDASGNVVGIGNPRTGATVSGQYTGTLPPGNYYVQYTWYDQLGNQTLPSPEVPHQVTNTGELQITPPPGSGPPQATGMDVYIGVFPGGEIYQGQTTNTTATFTQSVPLATTGATVPTLNNTPCRVFANDAAWPTGTGYQVSLTDASGNTLFSYPELWQFFGPGSTYNLSNGIPYYHGQVTYPVPVLTVPYNHNAQSISGPISLGVPGGAMYPLTGVLKIGVGTQTPAWGVDLEGAGLLGAVNAKTGYLINGGAGTANQCLASDGSYFDMAVNCNLGTTYYQTILTSGTAQTQRPSIGVGVGTGLTASDNTSPAETLLKLNTGANLTSDPYATITALQTGGTAGDCATWDGSGGVGDAGFPCYKNTPTTIDEYLSLAGCVFPHDLANVSCSQIIPLSEPMPDTAYFVSCTISQPAQVWTTVNHQVFGLTTTSFGYYELASGSSQNYAAYGNTYGIMLACHAHHN